MEHMINTSATSSQRRAAQRTLLPLFSSRSVSVAGATPSLPRVHLNLPSVPLVNERMFDSYDHSAIGNGRFGCCSQMAYKDLYVVCVTRMERHGISSGFKTGSCYSVFSQW